MARKILVIAAHPDDESLGCAGAMARHVADGDEVHVVCMTDGVGSRHASINVVDKRKSATEQACKIIGVSSIQNFKFPDNRMDSVPFLDIVQDLERVIEEIQPVVIYTHHIADLNIDHQIVHKAVMTACRPQPGFCVKQIYAFEVLSSTEWQTPGVMPFSPTVFIDITLFIETKRKALESYGEEMRQPPHSRSVENVLRLNSLRGNSVGLDYAEALVLLRELR